MVGVVGRFGWVRVENEACKKLNLLEFGFNFRGFPFNGRLIEV